MKHKPQLGRLSVSLAPSTESDNDSTQRSDDGILSSGGSSAASSFQRDVRDTFAFSPPLSAQTAPSASARSSPSPPPLPADSAAEVLELASAEAAHVGASSEFNDGLCSPWPADDPYLAAWDSLTPDEESAYLESSDYAHFASLFEEGRLALHERDFKNNSSARWKCLGFFLSRNAVLSLRFHGVDLQVGKLQEMKKVMVAAALANSMRRRAQRSRDNAMRESQPSLWTGGWGLDIDSLERERRKQELAGTNKLRSIIFSDTQLGRSSPASTAEAAAIPARAHARSSSPATATALSTTISLLLICELLESVSLWRNNLCDAHASELGRELISKHPSLKHLSLRWNVVTAEGARQLGAVLRDIHEHSAQSGNGAAGSSAQQKVGGGKFEELDLCFNRIDEAGVTALRADLAGVPCVFAGDDASATSSTASGMAAETTSASIATTNAASFTANSSISTNSPTAASGMAGASSSSSGSGNAASSVPASPPSFSALRARRPPFFLNLQRQHTPYCWRPQPQRLIDAHFSPFASSSFNLMRTARSTA